MKDGGRSDDRNRRRQQATDFLPVAKNVSGLLWQMCTQTDAYTYISAALRAACMHIRSGYFAVLCISQLVVCGVCVGAQLILVADFCV